MLIHLILLFYPDKTHRFTDPDVVLYLCFLPKPLFGPFLNFPKTALDIY